MSVLKLEPQQRSLSLHQVMPRASRRPHLVMAGTFIAGMGLILLFSLLLTIATSTGVYAISDLKAEKKNLAESVQILSAQVDSLSSAQNLSSAAQKLGMVANSNPVFLNVKAKKLYGKPMAAIKSSQGRITRNLVPNAQLTTKTKLSELNKTSSVDVAAATNTATLNQAIGKNADVATDSAAKQQVISNSGKLPGSPTN